MQYCSASCPINAELADFIKKAVGIKDGGSEGKTATFVSKTDISELLVVFLRPPSPWAIATGTAENWYLSTSFKTMSLLSNNKKLSKQLDLW